jgi:hypothetical protein
MKMLVVNPELESTVWQLVSEVWCGDSLSYRLMATIVPLGIEVAVWE